MDIFFTDPDEIPLPPAEVRIRELRAEPYPDGVRVRVYLETDPFQRRPNAEVYILDSAGGEIAHTSIIESMTRKMEMTLHLRHAAPGPLTLGAVLFYAALPEAPPPADPGDLAAASGSEARPDSPDSPNAEIERTVVDRREITFDPAA